MAQNQSQTQLGRMPEPTRFSKRIKDVDGHYDIDGVSQDADAEVVVASQRPVPKEHSLMTEFLSRLKKRTRHLLSK